LALVEIHVKQYPEDASMIEKEVGEKKGRIQL
jgi:hypothetical protein